MTALFCRSADEVAGRTLEDEADAEKAAAREESVSFEGCYSAILSSLLQLLPEEVRPPRRPASA